MRRRGGDPAPEAQILLDVRNLAIRIDHPNGIQSPVKDVSFSLRAGETFALVGESGSGKTMTALALLDLLPEDARCIEGEIWFKGRSVLAEGRCEAWRLRGRQVAMIFQDAASALNPVFRVGGQLVDIIRIHHGLSAQPAKERAIDLLRQVGFNQADWVFNAHPHQLSGGMAQRVMIAMALSCRPELIIADEPTSALDRTTQARVLALLAALQRQQRFALLLISHDIGLVSWLADSVAVMYQGRVVEQGRIADVLRAPRHPYTRELLDSVWAVSPASDTEGKGGAQVHKAVAL